jgi:hypothetical protein
MTDVELELTVPVVRRLTDLPNVGLDVTRYSVTKSAS